MNPAKVPRRPASASSLTEEHIAKRRKIELPPLSPEDFKNGVMLAPMVRSGTSTYFIQCHVVILTAMYLQWLHDSSHSSTVQILCGDPRS